MIAKKEHISYTHIYKNIFYSCVVLCVALGFNLSVQAQAGLTIECKVSVEKGGLDGTKVVIEQNGTRIKTMNLTKSKFDVKLEYNNTYILSFQKDGYVTKKIQITTNAPEDRQADGFEPFVFEVSIFKQYEGVNIVMFNQPVAKIQYSKEIDEFDYDTDYTKSIQAMLAQVMAQVAQKEKEEDAKPLQAQPTPKPTPTAAPVPQPVQQQTAKPQNIVAAPATKAPKQQPIAKKEEPKKIVETEKSFSVVTKEGELILMSVYTAALYGSSTQKLYGYINFGNSGGRKELSKEEFEAYRNQYYKN